MKQSILANKPINGLIFFVSADAQQGELIAEMDGLDFESQPDHTLRVIAVDQASDPANRLTSTTSVSTIKR